MPDHRTLFDWLSRDPAEVDKYIADPLCGWDASVSLWRDLFGFIFHGAADANFGAVRKDLPFMLVGGEKDPATDGGKAVEDPRRGACARWAFRIWIQGFTPRPATKRLNEINRDDAMEDFVAWADRVTGTR